MSEKNPYIYLGPLYDSEMFFGRKKETEEIFEYLQSLQNISIIGEPKIGKSSLLLHLCREKRRLDQTFDFVYVHLQDLGEISLESFFSLLQEQFKKAGVQETDFHNTRSFREFVNQNYEDAERKLILYLDEFEILTQSDLQDAFYSYLRGIASKRNIAFVIASREYLSKICQFGNAKDSKLWNIFKTFELKGLKENEAKELIEIPFSKRGVKLSIKAEKILSFTEFNPFSIVVACKHVFQGIYDIYQLKKIHQEEMDSNEVELAKEEKFSGIRKSIREYPLVWFFYGISVAASLVASFLYYFL